MENGPVLPSVCEGSAAGSGKKTTTEQPLTTASVEVSQQLLIILHQHHRFRRSPTVEFDGELITVQICERGINTGRNDHRKF